MAPLCASSRSERLPRSGSGDAQRRGPPRPVAERRSAGGAPERSLGRGVRTFFAGRGAGGGGCLTHTSAFVRL